MPFHRGYQGEFGSVEKSPKVLLFLGWRPFPQWNYDNLWVTITSRNIIPALKLSHINCCFIMLEAHGGLKLTAVCLFIIWRAFPQWDHLTTISEKVRLCSGLGAISEVVCTSRQVILNEFGLGFKLHHQEKACPAVRFYCFSPTAGKAAITYIQLIHSDVLFLYCSWHLWESRTAFVLIETLIFEK